MRPHPFNSRWRGGLMPGPTYRRPLNIDDIFAVLSLSRCHAPKAAATRMKARYAVDCMKAIFDRSGNRRPKNTLALRPEFLS